MTTHRTFLLSFALLAGSLPVAASAQQADFLPDSPGAVTAAAQNTPPPQPSHHFNGIVSTGGLVQEGTSPAPQTVHDKLILASEDTFDLYGLGASAVGASIQYANSSTPEFGKGGVGYARYYWHTYADRAVEIYMAEFIGPTLFHQDSRYYYLGKGGFGPRIGHAIKRDFVTRSDAGRSQFNFSEIVGTGAAAGVSSLYYPSRERSAGSVMQTWGLNIAVDAGSFIIQEFYPSVIHAIFH